MNTSHDKPEYGIDELAERGGVTRRTVRYYVRRGLLPAPTGTGRGKHYTGTHLRTLIRIRELQEAGVSLAEIQRRLEEASPEPSPKPEARRAPAQARRRNVTPESAGIPTPERARFTRVTLGPGLELNIAAQRQLGDRAIVRIQDAVRGILLEEGRAAESMDEHPEENDDA